LCLGACSGHVAIENLSVIQLKKALILRGLCEEVSQLVTKYEDTWCDKCVMYALSTIPVTSVEAYMHMFIGVGAWDIFQWDFLLNPSLYGWLTKKQYKKMLKCFCRAWYLQSSASMMKKVIVQSTMSVLGLLYYAINQQCRIQSLIWSDQSTLSDMLFRAIIQLFLSKPSFSNWSFDIVEGQIEAIISLYIILIRNQYFHI
jgi:hypothetical protein